MKKIIIAVIITAIISSALTIVAENNLHTLTDIEYINYKTLPYKVELIKAYEDYYQANEAWLDELEDDYGDLMSGSDANADYLEYKVTLDSLRNLEK